MTEFWKSNPNYWCDICKVWMTDNAFTRATHEKGIKHQELVAKKLRDMRRNADVEKSQRAMAEASFDSIEARAAKQYAQDRAAAEKHKAETLGSWNKEDGSGYMYNAVHRYYFDTATGMYYGGDPPAWTNSPKIPAEAQYQANVAPEPSGNAGDAPAKTAFRAGSARTQAAAPKRVVRISDKHMLSAVGGHQMPSVGTVGGAKGVGGAATAAAAAAAAGKRKREEVLASIPKKELSKEDAEALAKREAARARVQKRTMSSFGLA